jgi:PAS domain S-box-containing protein
LKELQESEEKYRSLFQSMGDGFLLGRLIRDGDGRPVDFHILDVNPACEMLTGCRPDRLTGRKISEIAPDNEPAWLRHIGEMVGSDEPVRFEEYSASKDKWLKVYAYPLHKDDLYAAIFCDVTKRRRTEEALGRSKAFLNNVFDCIQDGISVLDRDLNIVRTNHVMEEWYRHVMPLQGKKCYDVYHGRSMPCDICPSRRAIMLKAMQSQIVPFQGENSAQRGWLEIHSFPLTDADGNVTGVIEQVRDITGRKRDEESHIESEKKFRAMFENAGTAIFVIGADNGAILDCNQNAEMLIGRSREEIIRMTVLDLHPPDDQEKFSSSIQKLASRGQIINYEMEALHRDGRRIPVIVNATPMVINGRKIMMGFFLDITERKQAEEALRSSEEKFRALTETVSAAICIIQDGRFWYVNPAMETISGFTREELMSIDFRNLVHTDSLDYIKARYMDWLRGISDEAQGEFKGVDRYGMVHWADISRKTISYNGRPAILITGIDITNRKIAEEALLDAKAQAELYLDLMGHDISNMHQMALGFLEIARDAQVDEGQRALLDKPIEVLQRSARLIRNVRKLQRLREGTINEQTIDLCALLTDLGREYEPMSGKTVSVNLNGHTGCYVRADELLYDVFANLAGNAIKHTDGYAEIKISLESRMEEDRLCYIVSVEDNGPGIPDDFKDIVFKRLLKGTTKAKGSGIGLYLVKSLVDSYHGRVYVEDTVPGDHTKGARFVVLLPATGLQPEK